MRVLLANLKHLYQRRGLCLVYILAVAFVWSCIIATVLEPAVLMGRFIGLIVLAVLVGMSAAIIQMEVLTKPFAFCLPGHRQMVRSFIFAIGVVANLASATPFLFYPGLFPTERFVVLCSAFFAGWVFYSTGVWLTFRPRQPFLFVGLLAFAILGGRLLNLHILLEQAVVLSPVHVIVLGLLCASALWIYLSGGDLARRHCLRPWIGFGDAFNAEKLLRLQQMSGVDPWKRLKDHPRPWVENFFIRRMNRRGPFSMARFLWGSLYTSFAIPISRSSNALVLVPLLAIFLGYAGMRMWAVLAFAPLIITQAFGSRPTLHSTMLIAGSRAERFVSTLAVAIAAAGLLALFIAIIIATSILLAAVVPDITFRGFTLTYHAVGFSAFYAPVIFLPLVCTIQLVLYGRPVLMIILLMTLICLMSFGLTLGSELTRIAGPGTAVALAVGSWLIFASGVYRAAMHRDLASG
jgi:hypothetical protein